MHAYPRLAKGRGGVVGGADRASSQTGMTVLIGGADGSQVAPTSRFAKARLVWSRTPAIFPGKKRRQVIGGRLPGRVILGGCRLTKVAWKTGVSQGMQRGWRRFPWIFCATGGSGF
jgi:hypothetical protein